MPRRRISATPICAGLQSRAPILKRLEEADLRHVDLRGASLSGRFHGARFDEAEVEGAVMMGAVGGPDDGLIVDLAKRGALVDAAAFTAALRAGRF